MEVSSTGRSVVPFLAGMAPGDARQPPEDIANGHRPRSSRALIFLAWMAAVAALYVARDVIVPVTLALLLALLLRPILRRLRKLHWPDTLSSFVIVATVAVIFVGGLLSVVQQGQAWLAEAPRMMQAVNKMVPQNYGPIGDFTKAMNAVWGMAQSETTAEPVPVVVHSGEAAFTILGASGHFVGAALIVFVLAFFLLAFSDTLLNQAVESRSSFAQKRDVVSLLQNVESGISQYLATITIINICLGMVTGLALWLVGLPNPVLWGVVVMTLNYVPHVGAFICMVLLFLVGAVARESLWFGAGTAALFVVLTSAESYFITPLALSKSLQLSPLAVILSILFWGWLWGIAGGLMAAPLLAVMKIVCDQFESLRPWSVLISADNRRSAPLPSNSAIASENTAFPTSA